MEKLNIHMQKNKVVFLVYTIHKNLTQNKDLNIRPRLVKYLEENTLERLHDFGLDSNFWIWQENQKQQ